MRRRIGFLLGITIVAGPAVGCGADITGVDRPDLRIPASGQAADPDAPLQPAPACATIRLVVGHVPGHIAGAWLLECAPTDESQPPTSGDD